MSETIKSYSQFEQMNNRRIALIYKEVESPLGEDESAELARLQEVVCNYLDAKFPRHLDDAWNEQSMCPRADRAAVGEG